MRYFVKKSDSKIGNYESSPRARNAACRQRSVSRLCSSGTCTVSRPSVSSAVARARHGGEAALVLRQRQRADDGAWRGDKTGEHRERDGKAQRERRAALVKHLRAERGEPEHFLAVHGAQPPRLRDEPGIGGKHALHVGVDAALVRAQRRRRGHGGRVRAAAPERRDVVSGAHALKPGDEDDLSLAQLAAHALHRKPPDVRVAVCLVRTDAGLPAGERHGGETHFLQRHRHERNACLLAGGEQHVKLAPGWVGAVVRGSG